jgi:hypothetical protein
LFQRFDTLHWIETKKQRLDIISLANTVDVRPDQPAGDVPIWRGRYPIGLSRWTNAR